MQAYVFVPAQSNGPDAVHSLSFIKAKNTKKATKVVNELYGFKISGTLVHLDKFKKFKKIVNSL